MAVALACTSAIAQMPSLSSTFGESAATGQRDWDSSVDSPSSQYGIAAAGAGDCSQCGDCCDEAWPRWTIDAGSLLLWRNSSSVPLDGGVGPLLAARLQASAHHGWEAKYFSVFGMDGVPKTPRFVSFGSAYSYIYTVDGEYLTDLHSVEVNYVHTFQRLSIVGGFRFFRLDETYAPDKWSWNSGRYQSHTENNLYGGQIGLQWKQDFKRLFWEATGKVAVLGNDADVTISGSHHGSRQWDVVASLLGDLNVSLGYRISRTWALRCGYDFLCLHRVALAPTQNGGGANPDFNNTVFLQGADVSLEARW